MVLFYLILGSALLYLIYLIMRWFRQADPARIARTIKLLGLGVLFFLLLLTLVTGRLGLFLGGSLLLVPFIPRLYRFFKGESPPSAETQQDSLSYMTLEQAREILGVDETATRKQIIDAYKDLIRKIHPDQGGSDFLAAQVNRAKEVLLSDFDAHND